jgi:hypothetical protein
MKNDMANKYKRSPEDVYRQVAQQCAASLGLTQATPAQVLMYAEKLTKERRQEEVCCYYLFFKLTGYFERFDFYSPFDTFSCFRVFAFADLGCFLYHSGGDSIQIK